MAWDEFAEIKITSMERNMFLFTFCDRVMTQKVLDQGFWAIDGYCLNLK